MEGSPHVITVRARQGFLLACCCLAALLLRAGWIMVANRSHYLSLETLITPPYRILPADPGSIYDRRSELLARSKRLCAISADPSMLDSKDKDKKRTLVAKALHAQLGVPQGEIFARLAKPTVYVPIKSFVPAEQGERVRNLGLPGVVVHPQLLRVYPRGQLLANVLGMRCRANHRALEGFEWYWRTTLDGRAGAAGANVDAWGQRIIGAQNAPWTEPVPGKDMFLTIDGQLQETAERVLDDIMRRHRPLNATCTVLDPRTGEILAMACRPSFDPNKYWKYDPEAFRNRCVSSSAEPGSVFKVILMAAALEHQAIRPSDTFYCSGQEHVPGGDISCWGKYAKIGHGRLTATGCLVHSCNVIATKIARRVGREAYLETIRAFHFGARLGCGLPAEASGSVPRTEDVHVRELCSLGFGHNVAVTDLQMATAVAALANGGKLMWPHIVKEVRTQDGELFRSVEPRALGRPVSEHTAAQVMEMMEAVVLQGTGHRAKIKGVRVGGKTATAQKIKPAVVSPEGKVLEPARYYEDRCRVGFVGVAPLEAPRFVVYITADEPQVGEHGADVAAPGVRTILLVALGNANLLPPEAREELQKEGI